jgi:hypothetical protein
MLFDSDINVYEEANVQLNEQAEFNVRGKKTKIYSQKELDAMAQRRAQIQQKQELIRKEKAKLRLFQEAAPRLEGFNNVPGQEDNEYDYVGAKEMDENFDIGLATDMFGNDEEDRFAAFEAQNKLQKQRRKEKALRGELDQTVQAEEEEVTVVEEAGDIAPSLAKKKKQQEYLQRKEEEEARLQ